MAVEVLKPGRLVRVTPDEPSHVDVLDYALALVEIYGWNNLKQSGQESSEQTGYTLHDAIGAACTALSAETDYRGRGSKDWNVGASNLREAATRAVAEELPDGVTDMEFNDAQTDQQPVLDVLRAALRKARTGA